jgi:hypothetical protein
VTEAAQSSPVLVHGDKMAVVMLWPISLNLMHALASVAREISVSSGDDSAIGDNILAEIAKQDWAPHVNVIGEERRR